ncbi:hypothetical protein ACT7C7_00615 [Bacillus cereus]
MDKSWPSDSTQVLQEIDQKDEPHRVYPSTNFWGLADRRSR